MKGHEIVARILRAEGVEQLPCFPHNEIIDSAGAVGIRPIIARTERVAINMADGFSRVSGRRRFGVGAMQYGPGSENAFGAVAQAFADGSPILLIPGGYDRREAGIGPNFLAAESYRRVVRHAATVASVHEIVPRLRHAFSLLRNGRTSPVLIEIPGDVLNDELDGPVDYSPPTGGRPMGDAVLVREVTDALLRAERPVILAGQGVLYAEACAELKELAELLQVPVMTTMAGKSAFPENHPLSLGAGGRTRPQTIDQFLGKADFMLGIGTAFTETAYGTPLPRALPKAQITLDDDAINRDYAVSYGVQGDAKAVLRQIIEQAGSRQASGQAGDAVVREIKAVKDSFLAKWMPRLASEESPINPYRVVWTLMQTIDRQRSTVTHDSGNPRDQMVPFYESIIPNGYIGWGKSTQLGTGFGLAMGAKLANPDRVCVNVMGDAAFGMIGMDFETAVRASIPVLTVILNNGRMGGYEKYLPVTSQRYRSNLMSGNYEGVAQALGGYAERVERPADLAPAIKRAVAETERGRPALLEVITAEDAEFPMG